MDITRITQTNEGISEIVNRLEDLVGGNKYLINHNTPIIDVILLKAMLAWDRAEEDGYEEQCTQFAKSVLQDLYKVANYKVSVDIGNDETMFWDCVSQTFNDFKTSVNKAKKPKKCDCFSDGTSTKSCNCLKVEFMEKQSKISNEAISLLLARHVFNRRHLNLLGLPLPNQQAVYSLSQSLT
ncbi:hypothetical protein [Shewanella sp. SM96]|uniref:hypothetical protein n=1 Tax=Shewanella TaxID=22 RepID=UPI0021D855C9|nr:hypothetical protein [Shewanella sp. SM96]MCU8005871.1 hypothetical protein [Shewanella sp. SM96]